MIDWEQNEELIVAAKLEARNTHSGRLNPRNLERRKQFR
jgi:hypothetical protein